MIDLTLGGIENWARRHHPEAASGRAQNGYDCPVVRYAQQQDPDVFCLLSRSLLVKDLRPLDLPDATLGLIAYIDGTHAQDEIVSFRALLNLAARVREDIARQLLIDPAVLAR